MNKKLFVLAGAFLMLAACASQPTPNEGWTELHPDTYRHPSADADVHLLQENGQIRLENCGGRDGYAYMKRMNDGKLYIVAQNLDCSYYKTQFNAEENKLNGTQNNFSLMIPVNEDVPGRHVLTIGSKAYFNNPQPGSRADIITFYVPAREVKLDLWFQSSTHQAPPTLPQCKGTVEGKIVNGSVTLVFRNVENCDRLQIVHGSDVRNYNLQPQSYDYFGGGFSIPKDMVDPGTNTVHLYLTGPRNEARVAVQFFGL